MLSAMKLALGMIAAALCEIVAAQVIEPAAPRYLEPVYVNRGPNPYVQWNAAQVSMEGSTIVARIQQLRCNDLCASLHFPRSAIAAFV
jgi:hypothetical protein